MAKWIDFIEKASPTKTKRFVVASKQGSPLGVVKFYSHWRQYAFFPVADTLFEQHCLRDIADFCEQLTRSHRRKIATDLAPMLTGGE